MSSFEHHATVDKGLKMKIKRKNLNGEKSEKSKKELSKSADNLKGDAKSQGETSQSTNGMLTDKSSKLSLYSDRDKSPKSKTTLGKRDKGKGLVKGEAVTTTTNSVGVNGVEGMFSQSGSMEPKLGETAAGKKECVPDPYEFNAKVEDGISMPMKKIKLEKEIKTEASGSSSGTSSSVSLSSQDASTDTNDVAIVTDPDCLGPCEPGTNVTLEGIVWHESENGVLVVNVTWRGKTYVGTLLDATRHDWAPPRFNCDSPSIEFESRTPKGRGKRRGAANTPVQDTRTLRKGRRGSNVQTFTAPPSPAKSDISVGGVKRKGRPQDIDLSAEQRCTKRSRSGSQAPTPNIETPPADAQGYLECPEPKCNKKYKNANGLRYHQSHAHSGSNSNASVDDSKDDMDTEDVPLSVVKNSVRKEKEAKRDQKKDSNKDNAQNSDKSKTDKNENAVKKSDKDDTTGDSKDAGNKSDGKCDNNSTSKKKENNANKNSTTQSNAKSNSQNSLSKSNSSNNVAAAAAAAAQVPVSSSQVNSNSVQAIPSQTSTISPTTSSPSSSSSVIQSVSQGEKNDSKLVDIKPKITQETRVTKANRPIIPAPVLSSVQVTHSNLSPVVSHTQMSPQLKPIQPKPTIMGEPQNINPVLADLNKDRKKVQKKKNKDVSANGNSQNRPDQPTIKIERTGVIKTNPMPNNRQQSEHGKKEGSVLKDGSRQGLNDSQRSHTLAPHPHKSVDLTHSRGGQNPNLLKVGSPLQVNTPDHQKGAVNDDVQSPAYSDISDANESASPAAPSDTSPLKQREDNNAHKKEDKREATPPQQGDNQMMQHYGMYPYYAQSPYRMNEMSPGQKSNSSNSGAPPTPSQQSQESAGKMAPSNDKKTTENQSKPEKKAEEKDNISKPKGPMPPMSGPPPSNLSPQQVHEYQRQQMEQNMMYQQMYMQSLPQHVQYQYMVNGMYPPMDSNYVRQMMEEQHRRSQSGDASRSDRAPEGGQGPQDKDSSRGPEGKGQPHSGVSSGKKDDSNTPKALISPIQMQGAERSDINVKTEDKGALMKDQALRETQNETHQILKENIELKNEMDKNRHDYERLRKQDEERRRYQMYQEQKMFEERKKMELARKSANNRPENLTSKAPGTKPIVDHNQRNIPSGLRASVELQNVNVRERGDSSGKRDSNSSGMDIKKEVRDTHGRDLSANKYSDSSKNVDEKSRTPGPEKHRSETPTRNPDAPKQRPGGSSSKSGSPMTSSSSSMSGSPSFSPYVNSPYPPYMQTPHMGMDPSHLLYRNHSVNPALVSGYPGSAYIHPSQMGYRPTSGDDEKEKLSAQKSVTPSSESDLKKGDSHGPYYSNPHKIHELSEKGQPKSRNSSPGPVKSVESSFDKHREYTNSPPTQRHVHTHHHTHVLQPGPGLPVQPGPPLQGPPGFSPVYDPYSAMFVSQAQSPHPFPPK